MPQNDVNILTYSTCQHIRPTWIPRKWGTGKDKWISNCWTGGSKVRIIYVSQLFVRFVASVGAQRNWILFCQTKINLKKNLSGVRPWSRKRKSSEKSTKPDISPICIKTAIYSLCLRKI